MGTQILMHLHFNTPLPWEVVRVSRQPGEDFWDVHTYARFENSDEAKAYMEALQQRLEKLPK